MWLERIGEINLYVRWIYVLLLTLIAWLVFADVAKRKSKERAARNSGVQLDNLVTGLEWYKKLHQIYVPPIVTFKTSGVRCSLWLPVIISFATGFLAGLLGIGGGLFVLPAMIYLIGVPTHIAVGTSLFGVAISGLYGAATYSYKGRVELLAALIMLIGAAVGAQIGTVATKYVKGYGIRIFFGVAVIGCELSVILKIISAAYRNIRSVTNGLATVLILSLVSAMSLYIFIAFIKGAREERARQRELKARAVETLEGVRS
jgi:uncharacterized membrane protein YfcA